MNLSTKAVILLVLINSLEYSTANNIPDFYGCDDKTGVNTAFQKVLKCVAKEFDLQNSPGPNRTVIDEIKQCCSFYYSECTRLKMVLKKCSPKQGFNADVWQTYNNVTKECLPSRLLCAEHHTGTVDPSLCAENTYSECESYKPFEDFIINEKNDNFGDRREKAVNSFAPISVNGWALCLSLSLSVLIVV